MAGTSKGKNSLVFGLGRAIQSRRRALKRESDLLIGEIGLSASYYRSIEAGSVAAPPGIAMPLAFALDWDPVAVSELLCAIPYLSNINADERRRSLFEKGVLAPVLDAPDAEISHAIRRYFEGGRISVSGSRATKITESRGLPWMFEIALQKMARNISAVPFKIDKDYLLDVIFQYKSEIRNVVAYLSYIPNGTILEISGYDFGFLYNSHAPKLKIHFYDPLGLAPSVKADLVRAIDRLTSNMAPRWTQETRIAHLDEQVVIVGESRKRRFIYAPDQRKVKYSGTTGIFTKEYHNAWLYDINIEASTAYVGFIDDFMPEDPNFDTVALSTEDALNLISNILQ